MIHTDYTGTDARFRELCRDNNWRCTAQRRAIFTCLDGNRNHPTVESIWTESRRSVPDISLDSVYRILDDFAAAGIVRRLEGGRAVRYDPDLTPHDHYVCVRCGTLYDFHHLESGLAADACRQFGSVHSVELVVRGVCKHCQQKQHLQQ